VGVIKIPSYVPSRIFSSLRTDDRTLQRYAFYFLSLPYTPAPHWLSAVGTKITTHKGHTFCGHTMLQYGLSADEWTGLELDDHYLTPSHAPPLFLHANLLKHSGKRTSSLFLPSSLS
jgi:alpha 1,2-mannosyltransferase